MKTLSILAIFFTSFFIRALRWLAVVQQKEYRIDRLILFIKSDEGKKELFRIFPQKKDFSRTGLKRPKITSRILIVTIIFIILFSFLVTCLVVKSFVFGSLVFILYILLGLLIYLIITPILVMISILPTTLIALFRVWLELLSAKAKVKKIKPNIIGITGSYGKTSTKLLLATVLEKKYNVFKTPKSFNTKFSVAQSINKGFKNQEIMILEYGAYKKGEIKTLASWFKPNMAIITGLAKQHLGLFGNIEAIIEAKSELVKSLASGSVVIWNGNDKGAKRICEKGISEDSISKGNLEILEAKIDNKNSVTMKAHLNKVGKLQFVFAGQQVNTNLLGMHYLEIIVMVILVAKKLEVSDKDIVEAISKFVPDDKFIYSYSTKTGSLIIDDGGSSNLNGFVAAINLAAHIKHPKKVLITSGIVDLGNESNSIHTELAKKAFEIFDTVFYVGESGIKQFQSVFKDRLFSAESASDQTRIINFLLNLTYYEMILIEGRIPGWIKKYLK
ncbi:MAG: hypothetical protein COZ34_01265 [Candidatus Pacebacteria bacterium CG_4_10_14_3_um_filter_34_15]|nr:hypothetical protein [Candidatus Pacearchaeota archaeon]NCQ65293.1 hypothetical protein [Candidatus Paceibacterota bacterium]OIO44985.1 MAG: hypothetical protein AUJ41_00945 [Candidatus Pacebacteria bacterium CG1_02_43_31]PIQ81071.1 MAG: hypothetical protein COV78_02620 [Candidatus Pacebacteria bacterium CG11_big_fil_rev_8_21_14_0_20_34_55]PIX81888.1 MAG: hypothetical protein COZ34_01265 [Candidatus Pacebacteria bacterium CG_4_10_14_3_um_filter_34_15]PJC44103.1 MAG: hypothetical protein CO0